MKKLAILLAFFVSISASAASQQTKPMPMDACAAQMPYGMPAASNADTTLICRKAYALEHDNKAKIPKWVSYVLTPGHATGCERRTNAFAADASLRRGGRAELSDYRGSGYDTGHLANSADMSWDPLVERESFILSNMSPQLPGFNRGIWKKLEDQTRALVVSRGRPIVIYTGPIYKYDNPVIGKNNVIIPSGFYKILIDTYTKEVLVFEFKHEYSSDDLDEFIVDLSVVEKHTHINFPMPHNAQFSKMLWISRTRSVVQAKRDVCGLNW